MHAMTDAAGFRKTVAQLAWNSLAWFVSEPDHVVIMSGVLSASERLSELMRSGAGDT
jgi:hypothetical protein